MLGRLTMCQTLNDVMCMIYMFRFLNLKHLKYELNVPILALNNKLVLIAGYLSLSYAVRYHVTVHHWNIRLNKMFLAFSFLLKRSHV